MHPELFEVPFLHVTIKSWGLMVVIGFVVAMFLTQRMMKRIGQNPEHIGNAALYSLIAGVVGARVFYVIHHFSQFRDNPMRMFAIWEGAGEFLGGVLTALVVLGLYLYFKKLPARTYLDVLAIGLMIGLGFGRIGCFLSGCCFGQCTDVPWAVEFPYNSTVYNNQVRPDPLRDRHEPYIDLPESYFAVPPALEGAPKYEFSLKPFEELTPQQQQEVTEGQFQARPVHPTQLYSSLDAFLVAALLYGFWRWRGLHWPGATGSLMLILYGGVRIIEESLRDDNPFEHTWWALYRGGTISQNIGIYMILIGIGLFVFFVWKAGAKQQKGGRPHEVVIQGKSKS